MTQHELDPFRAWQDLVQKWEVEVNNWSGRFTENEQFSAFMGQATKMNLAAQKILADRMETTLSALNLPTKTQIDDLAQRLDAIENNIERIRIAIEQSDQAKSPQSSAKRAEPRRTRKPRRKSS